MCASVLHAEHKAASCVTAYLHLNFEGTVKIFLIVVIMLAANVLAAPATKPSNDINAQIAEAKAFILLCLDPL
jgi:hypothetical protein